MGANDPRGVANLDPRGMVGRINIGDNYALLHAKHSGPFIYNFNGSKLKETLPFCSFFSPD